MQTSLYSAMGVNMDKKTLYLECYSGISGDMTVAALIDLGADTDVLLNGLKSLQVKGYRIEISKKLKNSIEACDFNVILDKDNHDHDLDYLFAHENNRDKDSKHIHAATRNLSDGTIKIHGTITRKKLKEHTTGQYHMHEHKHVHDHKQDHDHIHSHDHNHTNGHGHTHSHSFIQYGMHEHRNLNDINNIIDASSITAKAKETAKKIFYIIAGAEAQAHGKSIEEVHFHEVGAIDSIVDIVSVAICLDNLNINEVIVSELYEGTGLITCQHGVLPVPVPAVVNIATTYGLPLRITNVKGELVTPTGAAIVAAIKTNDSLPKEFKIQKLGLGVGKRNYEQTSFLRAMLIEETCRNANEDSVWVLEANIDDCSGEVLSLTMDKLFEKGAKDVYYSPIYMKKNRPAYLLGVLCTEDKIKTMEEIIFIHTTTIGIRKHIAERTILTREIKTISTPLGEAMVKICTFADKTFYYPEYEAVKSLMASHDLDYQTVYRIIQNSCHSLS